VDALLADFLSFSDSLGDLILPFPLFQVFVLLFLLFSLSLYLKLCVQFFFFLASDLIKTLLTLFFLFHDFFYE
jgi:hypothetical protein